MKDKKQKKKIYVSLLVGVMLAGVLSTAKTNGEARAWGPERTTYTNENPASQAVFNSITNNAAVGDERNFVRIVEVDASGEKHEYMNEVDVTGGHDYEVYIYYHNNASETYNDKKFDYVGVARDVRLTTSFPTTLDSGEQGTVSATIAASNTIVPKVWDEAYLNAKEKVTLAYVSASAKLYNSWNDGTVLSTTIFDGTGTLLGLNELNGIVLGCDQYSGYVLYRIRATKVEETTPDEPERPPVEEGGFTVDKEVSKDGAQWTNNVVVEPGATMEFRVTFKNTGTVTQKNVTVSDTLEGATGLEYVAGSTRIVRGDGTETIVQDGETSGLFGGGLLIGDVTGGATVEVHYKVKVLEQEKFACGKTVLYNLAGVSANREGAGVATRYDKVQVEVTRDDDECLPTEIPETGPAQIILASVVSLGLLVGMGYWLNSKYQLRKLEQQAKGVDKNAKM